ncbi:MAG: hypothetical protein ABW039_14385 [Sphingobium sp.]
MIPQILLGAYLLFLVAAGWRLFGVGWTRNVKMAAGAALVLPMPALFLLLGLFGRTEAFDDILVGLGLTLLACGLACLGAGAASAWLRARR